MSKTAPKTKPKKSPHLALAEPPVPEGSIAETKAAAIANNWPRLLSKAEVVAITGHSFTTIWKWMRAGKFPAARSCGGRVGNGHSHEDGSQRAVWLSSEVDAWMRSLPPITYKPKDKSGAADNA